MKLQRVNLLPKREKPKRDWLSLSMMGVYVGAGIGFMLIWMLWSLYSNYSTQAELKTAQRTLTTLQARTNDLQTELQSMKPDDGLLARQSLLQKRIDIKRALMGELVTVSRANQAGFALPMFDLAFAMPDGVWLHSIRLGNDDHQIVLNGFTQHPALLTILVDQLAITPRFTLFHVISIQSQQQDEGEAYSFELIGHVTLPASVHQGGQP
jgi:Tfp pilus assembly protein PilN